MHQLPNSKHQEELVKVTSINTQIGVFNRVMVGHQIIHSVKYMRSKKRNNHTITYNYNGIKCHGEILYYVTNYSEIFAIIRPFSNCLHLFPIDDITNCTIPHIHIYGSMDDSFHAISLNLPSIRICISISFQEFPGVFYVVE